jgi:hypothetical protein
MKFHKDGTEPTEDDVIFVFGSNLAGIHGAGAAKAALNYGAQYGKGIGLSHDSYAIPTKDENIRTMPLYDIIPHIDAFAEFTHANPKMKFWVTRIGCGLAGYTDDVIAPLFRECNSNCSFAEDWKVYL